MSPLPTAPGQPNSGTWKMGVIPTPRWWVPWQRDTAGTKTPRRATEPSAWHLLPSGRERERQLSWTWTTPGDAQMAPVQLLDCELQTRDVIQINSLLFKAMLFTASHQRPCKHVTHNHSNIWLETKNNKPWFQWNLLTKVAGFLFFENTARKSSEMLQQGQRGISNCPEDTQYNAQFWQEHDDTQISNKTKPSICNCDDICFAIPSSLSHSPRTTEKQRQISRMEVRTLPLATHLLLRPKSVRSSLQEDSGLKQMNQVFLSETKISLHWKKVIFRAYKMRKSAKLS